MASLETRKDSRDRLTWRVRFRHQGSNIARSFTDESTAQAFLSTVRLLGPARALTLLDEAPAAAPVVIRTVSEQIEHHIDHLTGVEDGTRLRYRRSVPGYGALGKILLTELTADDVAAWVNSQTAAPKTIRNRHALLSAALERAHKDHLVPANVAKGIRLPKAGRKDRRFLTPAELRALLDVIPEHYHQLVLTMVGTGIRFGEATALRARHVTTDGLTIEEAWKYTGGSPRLGEPKTDRSRRTVAVPAALHAALLEQAAALAPDDWLLASHSTRGGRRRPIRSSSFHEAVWQPAQRALEKAGGRRFRVHDLRHTFASWAIQSGTPLPVIQRQMGHESIQTTVDTYGHLVRDDFALLASRIAERLPTPPAAAQIED